MALVSLRSTVFACLVVAFDIGSVFAQQNTDIKAGPGAAPVECTLPETPLMKVAMSLWDEKSNVFVKGLESKQFKVFEGKTSVNIEYFCQRDDPITVGIILDVSGSMQSPRISGVNGIISTVDAMRKFVVQSNPANKYFLITFADKVSEVLNTTQDKKEIEKVFDQLLVAKPKGNTSFYDAVSAGLTKMAKTNGEKKVILVVSDGNDNSSRNNDVGKLQKQSRESRIPIYWVNYERSEHTRESDITSSSIYFVESVKELGGEIFYPKNLAELNFAFERIANQLRAQYTIGFSLATSETKSWHKIKVRMDAPKTNGKVILQAPKGYFY